MTVLTVGVGWSAVVNRIIIASCERLDKDSSTELVRTLVGPLAESMVARWPVVETGLDPSKLVGTESRWVALHSRVETGRRLLYRDISHLLT